MTPAAGGHLRGLVIQMHGVPGSGKSTVAQALAPRIDAVVLDKDVIKSALLRIGIPEAQSAAGAYETHFDVARDFVRQGHGLILDNPVFWPRVEQQWRELAASAGSPLLLIECVCPDEALLERRLLTRAGRESQPRVPLDLLRHPGSQPTAYQPRLVLDTTRPLAECVDAAFDYVLQAVPA